MCCSFCLDRGCGKARDAETNTYCSDTEDLQIIITELQQKNETLEKYCAELEEEIEVLKAAHKDFVIDQPPSFTEPSPPPLTPPPVQLKPPDTESPDSGDDWSLKPPHTGSPDSGDDEKPSHTGSPDSGDDWNLKPPHTGSPDSGDEGSLKPPHTGSPDSGDDWSLKPPYTGSPDSDDEGSLKPPHTGFPDSGDDGGLKPPHTGSPDSGDDGGRSRRVRPARRRAGSTVRRRSAKNKSRVQPPVEKTATETAGTSAELPSGAPAGEKSVAAVDKPRLRRQKEETRAQERSLTPPCDVLGISDGEDQYRADDSVDSNDKRLPDCTSTADIRDMGEAVPEREDQEREERLNAAPEREERLNAPPERKVGKRRRPAVNYREEEDPDVDDPKSAPELEVVKRRRSVVNQKKAKDQDDAGNSVEGGTARCLHCEFTCLGQDRLDLHVKQRHGHLGRNGRYKCDWCEYSTDRTSNIIHHRRTHTGERPYRCDDCGKAFTERSHLTRHSRIHTGQRPYVCDICGRAFPVANSLVRHKRIHTGEKVAKCERCDATFKRLSHYTVHMKYHNAVKEHRCHMCSARFVARKDLSDHVHSHTGERPYVCSFCSVRFTKQSNMKQHVTRLHTHDYKHRCCRCDKGFLRSRELRKHEAKCFPAN